MLAATKPLSWQKLLLQQTHICRDKIFFRDKYVFVVTKVLSWQAYFSRDKRRVLSGQIQVCRDKSKLVEAKLLSRQNYVCRDKNMFVATKSFATKDPCLSNMILVAVSPMTFLSPPPPPPTPEISVPTGGTTSPETNSALNYLIYAPFHLPVGFTASNPHHPDAAAATMGRHVCTIRQPWPPGGEKALLRRIDKQGS